MHVLRVLNFILVIALTSTIAISGQFCPNFVTSVDDYTTFGSTCYVLNSGRLTWQEADLYCKNSAPNGRLAKVESSSLMTELRVAFSIGSSYSRAWIGGYSQSSGSNNSRINWFWSSYQAWPFNDENVTTSLWAYYQNEFGNLSCMSTSLNYLYADDCSQRQRFLCAYDCIQKLELNGSDAIITSPGYPISYYPANTRCEWFIDVIKPPALVELYSFSTELSYDYLSIKEMRNSSSAIKIFSGFNYPQTFTIPSRYMYLLFNSDGSSQFSGFSLSVRSLADVPVKRLTGHGILTSDSFPSNYTNHMTTKWLLSVANGTIMLNFTDFSLQPGLGSNCTHDRLLIRERGPDGRIIGIFCGEQLPQNIFSASGALYLQMDTDLETSSKGFRAVFHRKEDKCVHVLSSRFGNITSPGFPSSYPPNLKCAWYIDVLEGVAILKFSNYSLFASWFDSCNDRVEVYGGYTNNETQLQASCGAILKQKLASATRYITIYMATDGLGTSTGFAASFRSSNNCSYVYRQESGMIMSPDYPNYYDPYTNCSWLIDVKKGPATLQFTGINMLRSSECTTDSIEVFDGNSTASPLIKRFCKMISPITVNASSQFLFIKMTTGSVVYGTGFSALFYRADNECPMTASTEFYSEYLSWNGNCYGLTKAEYSWQEGLATCEKFRASLLFIESAEELNAINGWLSQKFIFVPSIWTGAYRKVAQSVTWLWKTKAGDMAMIAGIVSLLTGENTTFTSSVFLTDNMLYLTSNPYTAYQVVCKVSSQKNKPLDSSKVPCAAPMNIHAGYYTPTLVTFPSGSKANYYCEKERVLFGNGTVTCENGFWIGNVPMCIDGALKPVQTTEKVVNVDCLQPDIENSIYIPSSKTYTNGAAVSVLCTHEGKLSVSGSLICVNGVWSGISPSCRSSNGTIEPSQVNQVSKPDAHTSQGSSGNNPVVLPITVTLIVVLAVVIVAGVIFFIIYRRRVNPPRLLTEMQ